MRYAPHNQVPPLPDYLKNILMMSNITTDLSSIPCSSKLILIHMFTYIPGSAAFPVFHKDLPELADATTSDIKSTSDHVIC